MKRKTLPLNIKVKGIGKLVAECLAILCKIIMSLHIYTFGGKVYLQQPHGCIGDEAVGVIATIVMIWWARRLREKFNELNIKN